jgi:TolB-like protein/Tfp pilus assembly protein PilF/transcriptional regulator with XRE-family HTH domain
MRRRGSIGAAVTQASPETIDSFAARLVLAMKALNLSRGQLAAAVGVDKSLVSRWASGQVVPTDYNLARISDALAKAKPGFNMMLWDRSKAEFDAFFGATHAIEAPTNEPIAGPSNAASAVLSAQPRPDPQNAWRVQPPEDAPMAAGAHGKVAPAHERLRRAMRWSVVTFAIVLLSAAVMWWTTWNPPRAIMPAARDPLLAVLPFENLGGDAQTRYFSDGITEEIVEALLRTTQIRIAAPGASFNFRGEHASEATKAMSATHILRGSVQRQSDHVRVVARLSDVRDSRVIWSRTYDRTLAEAPALQRDIAVQIADALDMQLSSGALDEARTVNPVAYDHYLKARDLLLARDDLEVAISELEVALRLAPRFAKAWSTLAMVHYVLSGHQFAVDEDDKGLSHEHAAQDAARHALALDPNDPEALGLEALYQPRGHLVQTGQLLDRALRTAPNNTQLLNWHAGFLRAVGRNGDAANELARAYELDRVTPSVALNLASARLQAGEFEDVMDILDLERDSLYPWPVFNLRVEYHLFQRDWAGLARQTSTIPHYIPPDWAQVFRLYGETATALAHRDDTQYAALRARLRNMSTAQPDSDAVQFLTALGDTDGALNAIQAAVAADRSSNLMMYGNWVALFADNLVELRRNPRLPGLLASWGLFDYWRTSGQWPDFCSEPGLSFDCKAEVRKNTSPAHS